MGIQDYSTTPANNTALFPEGMARATVNDSARQLQADTRTWYETAEWVDYGYIPTYVSTSSFSMSGDRTTFYTVNRRIRITDSSTLYGTITASSFSAGNTTVTVTLDSGSISASIIATALHIVKLASQGLYLTGMTLAGTTALTNATISDTLSVVGLATFADIKVVDSINDTNNNEIIKIGSTTSAVNEITITNAATGFGATIASTGDDTNIDLNLQAKGTGVYNFKATSTAAATIKLFEDTDNGTNSIAFKAPDSIASDVTFTVPSADGLANQLLKTNGSGVQSYGWANVPAFSAYRTTQTVTNDVATKLQVNTENYDTNSYYDSATNYRFTPLVAGWYQVTCKSTFVDAGVAAQGAILAIYKNGAEVVRFSDPQYDNGSAAVSGSDVIYFNGSTDYIELYGRISGASAVTITDQGFSAFYLGNF